LKKRLNQPPRTPQSALRNEETRHFASNYDTNNIEMIGFNKRPRIANELSPMIPNKQKCLKPPSMNIYSVKTSFEKKAYRNEKHQQSKLPSVTKPSYADSLKNGMRKIQHKVSKSIESAAEEEGFKTVENRKRFFPVYMSNIEKGTNEETVKEMLKKRINDAVEIIKLDTSKHNRFDSHRFKISYEKKDLIFNSAIWPKNLFLRKFRQVRVYEPRQVAQFGAMSDQQQQDV
jgi:hypothetical protein